MRHRREQIHAHRSGLRDQPRRPARYDDRDGIRLVGCKDRTFQARKKVPRILIGELEVLQAEDDRLAQALRFEQCDQREKCIVVTCFRIQLFIERTFPVQVKQGTQDGASALNFLRQFRVRKGIEQIRQLRIESLFLLLPRLIARNSEVPE
jgi:hypothetical protein